MNADDLCHDIALYMRASFKNYLSKKSGASTTVPRLTFPPYASTDLMSACDNAIVIIAEAFLNTCTSSLLSPLYFRELIVAIHKSSLYSLELFRVLQ